MKAVHFGAGNIGRGFVGQLLHESGYEVVFADVIEPLIRALDAADSYRVLAVGDGTTEHVVTDFRALDSVADEARLVDEISSADLVTTAVGVRALPLVAPVIARGIERRVEIGEDVIDGGRLGVIACENAIGATSLLEAEVRTSLAEVDADRLDAVAAFANTAIDRIVPAQAPGAGLDLRLEAFFEWVVDRTPFAGAEPEISGVHWVDDLAPFLERKLFTVNSGHATAAYHGFVCGIRSITEAMTDEGVRAEVVAVTAETRRLLVAKFGLDEGDQAAYGRAILDRLSNPDLPDTVERIGRGPMRKLGRADRLVGPAAQLAERGLPRDALLRAIAAALRFEVADDPESVELQRILRDHDPADAVRTVTGVSPDDPLFADLLPLFRAR